MKKRIWELDALRGLFVIGMILCHLMMLLDQTFGSFAWIQGSFFTFVSQWGGVLFFLISGICITLGHHPIRRGLVVLACGAVVSAVSFLLNRWTMMDPVYFGVLHCLGVCMLLWPVLQRLPCWAMAVLAVAIIVPGVLFEGQMTVSHYWGVALGFTPMGFTASDHFPLMPFLGFFLAGALLGKLLYKKKETLFPNVHSEYGLFAFFCAVGRWSLPLYLLHQPVLMGIVRLLEAMI